MCSFRYQKERRADRTPPREFRREDNLIFERDGLLGGGRGWLFAEEFFRHDIKILVNILL